MSQVEEAIKEHNEKSKADAVNADVQHMAELEAQRIADEQAVYNSSKAAWERLNAKRNRSQVLRRLPLTQLQ